MQRLKFWLSLLAAAVLAGTATRQIFAGSNLDGVMSVLGCIGWFVLALRRDIGEKSAGSNNHPDSLDIVLLGAKEQTMFTLIDKLVSGESFALQAWDDRYSKGVWVGLAPNEYDLDVIRDLSSAGDLDMIPATDFVLSADWLPVVVGGTLVEAMSTLEMRLAGLPSEQILRASDWARSVSDAFDYLRRASRQCENYGEMDGKLKSLPEKYNGEMPVNF